MADGLSSAAATNCLTTLATDYTWAQLHVGAPGSAGTANVASNSTRKQITWGSASANSVANSADVTWSAVGATEAYTHVTIWTASTSGTFGMSGAVTNGSVTSGNDFKFASGDITGSFTLAS